MDEVRPPAFSWGPERTTIAKAALDSLPFAEPCPSEATLDRWAEVLTRMTSSAGP